MMMELRGGFSICCHRIPVLRNSWTPCVATYSTKPQADLYDSEFPKLDLIKSRDVRRQPRKRWEKKEVPPPRYKKMAFNQDWPSVWPAARTFHPASVPLPLYQGHVKGNKGLVSPGKFANLELMKIPNFLHLTPPAIYRHCEALKKFCTPWPEALKTDEDLQQNFPLEVLSNDYLHSSPTIRDFRSRIVTIRIKSSELNFDEHAKDKFCRLVSQRYDITSDYITFVIDCCPLRKQNFDYGMYLLTAVYHESKNTDAWEAEKSEDDMEKYVWNGSVSQKILAEVIEKIVGTSDAEVPSYVSSFKGTNVTPSNIEVAEPVQQYRDATTTLHNTVEDEESVEKYGKAVRNLFNLPLRTTPC